MSKILDEQLNKLKQKADALALTLTVQYCEEDDDVKGATEAEQEILGSS